MSAIAPEAFELAKVVVIGRLTGCCGPLANEVAARRTGKKLRSFMVFTSFQNVLRHGTKRKIYSLRFFLRSRVGNEPKALVGGIASSRNLAGRIDAPSRGSDGAG